MAKIEDITAKFEQQHLRNILRAQTAARKSFYAAITRIIREAAAEKLVRSGKFKLSDYPKLQRRVDAELKKMVDRLQVIILNGIETEWALSTEKNQAIWADYLAGKNVSDRMRKIIANKHKGALEAFKTRRAGGMNLSTRVWNIVQVQFRKELEQVLYTGIASGTPAKTLATQAKRYLNEPDKLFRRVRDTNGQLQLSKNAQKYHPGPGVYRSSYKNALRLTATEINMANRKADSTAYSSIPFVIGIEVKLSLNHPQFDICDHLKGRYPKNFVFTGWHPFCICFMVPILASDSEYGKFEDALIEGRTYTPKGQVKSAPQLAKWYEREKERLSRLKAQPYFVRDNPNFFVSS